MADLDRARNDLGYFAEAIGCQLEPWQARDLAVHEREARETVGVGPRRSGKSRGCAVLALHHCFRRPESHALTISATEEGAKRQVSLARRIAAGSPLLGPSVVDEQARLLVLSNGSTLRCTAATEAAVRGWSASLVIADEAALIGDDVLLGAARPVIASEPDGRFVMISSALRAGGAFYDAVRRAEAGGEHVYGFRWALEDCHWISPSDIEAARESLSPTRFAAEYLGEFASGQDALFTRQALDRATADFETVPLAELQPPARLIGAADWGQVTDRSALVAVARLHVPGERVFGLVSITRWEAGRPLTTGRVDAPGVVEEIAQSPAAWSAFVAEANGLGQPIAGTGGLLWRLMAERPANAGGARRPPPYKVVEDHGGMPAGWHELQEQERRRRLRARGAGFTTDKVSLHVTAEVKAHMYATLRMLIEQQRLVVPASAEELRRELLTLAVDLSPGGSERIEAARGHDDLADAAAMCTVPFRGRDGWRSWLAELADPQRALPDPMLPRGLPAETVKTGGGLELPRRPALVSVAGPEVTAPGAGPPADDHNHPHALEPMEVGFRRP